MNESSVLYYPIIINISILSLTLFDYQCAFVILGNLLNLYVMIMSTRQNRTTILLGFTSVVDIIIVSLLKLQYIVYDKVQFDKENNLNSTNSQNLRNVGTYIGFGANVATMSSTWAVLMISLDRLRAIKFPLRIQRTRALKKGSLTIICIISFTIIGNMTRLFKKELKEDKLKFQLIFGIFRVLVHIIIPLIVLTVVNLLLIYYLRTHNLNFQTAKWNKIKQSFDATNTVDPKSKNERCSMIWSRKHASNEIHLTLVIILLIFFHVITFLPTTLYHIYIEIILLTCSFYDKTKIKWTIVDQVGPDGKHYDNLRMCFANISICILVFGKIANIFLLSNSTNSCLRSWLWKNVIRKFSKNNSIKYESSTHKPTRLMASSLKIARKEEKSSIEKNRLNSVNQNF
uniref:G_PROTEIN_RECEP_F1_2 domain-containing protein n=1 Tax=Rhabditophanes sp. KR3021 TaxID=114890 RepID=A0AC35UI28_9BILA